MPPLITVPCRKALKKGVEWLVRKVEDSTWTQPAPIGFYFAKLWYYERLYPMIFTAGALGCASSIDMHRTEGNSGSS
jgi:squalene-hopene/tetraprenyl-beta-curcumene cyclase